MSDCVGILEGMDKDEVKIGGPEVAGSEEAEEDMVFLCGQRVFFKPFLATFMYLRKKILSSALLTR